MLMLRREAIKKVNPKMNKSLRSVFILLKKITRNSFVKNLKKLNKSMTYKVLKMETCLF